MKKETMDKLEKMEQDLKKEADSQLARLNFLNGQIHSISVIRKQIEQGENQALVETMNTVEENLKAEGKRLGVPNGEEKEKPGLRHRPCN